MPLAGWLQDVVAFKFAVVNVVDRMESSHIMLICWRGQGCLQSRIIESEQVWDGALCNRLVGGVMQTSKRSGKSD